MRVDQAVPGDAAQVTAGRTGSDEGSRVSGQLRHPSLVAQNTPWEMKSEIRSNFY